MDEKGEKTEFSLREVFALVEEIGKKDGYNEFAIMMAKQAFSNYYNEDYNRKHGNESFVLNRKLTKGLRLNDLNNITNLLNKIDLDKFIFTVNKVSSGISVNKIKHIEESEIPNELLNFNTNSLKFVDREFSSFDEIEKELNICKDIFNKILNTNFSVREINNTKIKTITEFVELNDKSDILSEFKDINSIYKEIKTCVNKLIIITEKVKLHIKRI